MKRLATFAFALIALGLAVASVSAEVAAPDHIVVFDAPNDFPAAARKLGFTKVETFAALDMTGYRMRVPSNASAATTIAILKTRFPAATINAETTDDFAFAN